MSLCASFCAYWKNKLLTDWQSQLPVFVLVRLPVFFAKKFDFQLMVVIAQTKVMAESKPKSKTLKKSHLETKAETKTSNAEKIVGW